ncbi:MAG: hypothetical protein CMM94_07670 [Rickettsiales bacterium]|nr:hypothetical protein [Rickettsiales bacterium]|tara:strand:- start:123 stop:575 length:453 start_codon:yes stop_codon:yes gene_type:complete
MITLLGAIVGFLGSLVPDGVKLLRDWQDRKHELAILQLQLQQQQAGSNQRLEAIHTQADIAETAALYQTYHSGIGWVDALNGTVRPVLAYAFFVLYFVVKLLQFSLMDASWPPAISLLWQAEDQAIFAGIISFYFGQRAMSKLRQPQRWA